MKKSTVTLERYHVWGTPNKCLALFYRGQEYTPTDKPGLTGHRRLPQWIPDDAEGIERMRKYARHLGFTHWKIEGDWTNRTKPQQGKL